MNKNFFLNTLSLIMVFYSSFLLADKPDYSSKKINAESSIKNKNKSKDDQNEYYKNNSVILPSPGKKGFRFEGLVTDPCTLHPEICELIYSPPSEKPAEIGSDNKLFPKPGIELLPGPGKWPPP